MKKRSLRQDWMSRRLTGKDVKIGSLVLLAGFAALAHYFIPTDRHDLHMIHR